MTLLAGPGAIEAGELSEDDRGGSARPARLRSHRFGFDCPRSLAASVHDYAADLSVRDRIALGERLGALGDGLRAAAAAELVGADGDTRAAERALAGRNTSKRLARRHAKRAAAAAKNAAIADQMATGDLTGEQVDAIADADRKTDGAASSNNDLIDRLAGARADETDRIVDDFVQATAQADTAQKEHDRQRSLRSVRKHRGRFGLGALTIEGDKPSIDAMYAQLRSDANRLYVGDGGRDLAAAKHPRTNDQRLFDAAQARVTGCTTPNGSASAGDTAKGAATDAAFGVAGDVGGRAAAGAGVAPSTRYTPPAARRPVVVVTASLDKVTGRAPDELAHQIGTGPIADSVLARYLGDTAVGVDLVGLLFGTDGQPLWLGRNVRAATDAQFMALVVRDKACVRCHAPWQQCEAHHLVPWHAPAKGRTDIDKLALVCGSCHHELHDQRLTLYRDRQSGQWQVRPATPAEIPPQRRPEPSGARR